MNRTMWHYKAKDGSKQVAGFVKHFQNLSVVTVKVCNVSITLNKWGLVDHISITWVTELAQSSSNFNITVLQSQNRIVTYVYRGFSYHQLCILLGLHT